MSVAAPVRLSPSASPARRLTGALPQILMGCFLLSLALVCALPWLPIPFAARPGAWHGLLLILAVLTITASLSNQLPAQNVVLASALILIFAVTVECLNQLSGSPFGPQVFNESLGPKLFRLVPCPVPFLWLVVLLGSRGMARLILNQRRIRPNYGWWVLGLTVVFATVLQLALDAWAEIYGYWTWKAGIRSAHWFAAPWTSFIVRSALFLLLLGCITPVLMDKKSAKPMPASIPPAIVWGGLALLFLSGALRHIF